MKSILIFLIAAVFLFSCAGQKPEKKKFNEKEMEDAFEEMGKFQGEEDMEFPDEKEKEGFYEPKIEEENKPEAKKIYKEEEGISEFEVSGVIYPIDLGNGWIKTMGEAEMVNITYEEAQKLALERAHKAAIEKVLGLRLQGDLFISEETGSGVEFVEFIKTTSSGKIVQEKETKWEIVQIKKAENSSPIPLVRIFQKVKVEKDKGALDPEFHISVDLDRVVYREGEGVFISITSTKDCFITVFSESKCGPEPDVLVLFPNDYEMENFIKKGETFLIPNKKEVHFKAKLPEGFDDCIEFIKVIATKSDIPYTGRVEKFSYLSVMQKKTAALDVARWLSHIPLSHRAEVNILYRIVK